MAERGRSSSKVLRGDRFYGDCDEIVPGLSHRSLHRIYPLLILLMSFSPSPPSVTSLPSGAISPGFSSNPRRCPSFGVERTTFVIVLVTPSIERISARSFSKEVVFAVFTLRRKLSSPVT